MEQGPQLRSKPLSRDGAHRGSSQSDTKPHTATQGQVQPVWVRVAWAVGRFPMALLNAFVPAFIPFFWVDSLGLSVMSSSFSWSLQSALAAIAGPLWGRALDNTNTGYGRYAPYHLLLALSWFLLFWGLVDPPAFVFANSSSKSLFYALFLSAYGVLTVLGHVMVGSSNYELFAPGQQGANTGLLQFFLIIGILLAQLSPVIAGDDWSTRGHLALIFGGISSIAQLVCLVASSYAATGVEAPKQTTQKATTPSKGDEKRGQELGSNETEQSTFFSLFQPTINTLKNQQLFRAILGNSVCTLGLTMLSLIGGINLKYVLRFKEDFHFFGVPISPTLQGVIVSAEPVVLGLMATPLTIKWLEKWGVNGLWRKSSGVMGALALGIVASIPNAHNFLTTLIAHALFGFFVLPAFMMLPDVLVGKVITMEMQRNKESFPGRGAVLGTFTFMVCLINSFCGTLQAAVLGIFGYVQPTSENPNPEQPSSVRYGIQFLLYIVPFLCFYASSLIIPQVPATEKPIKELKRHKNKVE